MRLIGLTGGIASGKSLFARHLSQRGIPVIDADQVARDVVAPGQPGLEAIIARFGSRMLTKKGELNRTRLGELVFADSDARSALEGITHPLIAAETARRVRELAAKGHELIVYEAALLFEVGSAQMCQATILIATSEELQKERLMKRDGLSEEEAQARIASQWPLERKLEQASYVIYNNGSLRDLERHADELLRLLISQEATR